jgi:serine/threonine protein kinase
VLIAETSPVRVKLADFGIAKSPSLLASVMETRTGSSAYMAPEVSGYNDKYLRRPGRGGYTKAVDMWALGALTHEIYTGIAPFCIAQTSGDDIGDDTTELSGTTLTSFISYQSLGGFCSNSTPFPEADLIEASAPDTLIGFIKETMKYDPEARLSASEALKHPWTSPVQHAIAGLQLSDESICFPYRLDTVFIPGWGENPGSAENLLKTPVRHKVDRLTQHWWPKDRFTDTDGGLSRSDCISVQEGTWDDTISDRVVKLVRDDGIQHAPRMPLALKKQLFVWIALDKVTALAYARRSVS